MWPGGASAVPGYTDDGTGADTTPPLDYNLRKVAIANGERTVTNRDIVPGTRVISCTDNSAVKHGA